RRDPATAVPTTNPSDEAIVNYCCQIRVSGPQDLERDAGTAPFVAVRRNHVVPSRPLVYLSQQHDAALVDCL
ncbi:hypothetical protein NO113_20295, partial [Clostridioides difficile]|nr:hypothetical protein [Clostridioides difficile]